MKLINLFIIVGICMVNAVESYSQSTQLSLNVKNSTLEEVFRLIEEQSEYVFFYSDEAVDLHKRVSIQVKDQTIDKILDQLLEQTGNRYVVDDRQVFIGKKLENKEVSGVSQAPKKVTGVVVDETGLPIVGANVSIKGTSQGTVTDMDGKFSLEVSVGHVIVVSYLGYVNYELKVTSQTENLSITMKEDSEMLDEVVVVGYGTQKRSNLTGAVDVVSSKELENRPVTSASAMLQGKATSINPLAELN